MVHHQNGHSHIAQNAERRHTRKKPCDPKIELIPLRKDSPVQIRMTPTSSEALQVTAEEFRANVMKDRLTRG